MSCINKQNEIENEALIIIEQPLYSSDVVTFSNGELSVVRTTIGLTYVNCIVPIDRY